MSFCSHNWNIKAKEPSSPVGRLRKRRNSSEPREPEVEVAFALSEAKDLGFIENGYVIHLKELLNVSESNLAICHAKMREMENQIADTENQLQLLNERFLTVLQDNKYLIEENEKWMKKIEDHLEKQKEPIVQPKEEEKKIPTSDQDSESLSQKPALSGLSPVEELTPSVAATESRIKKSTKKKPVVPATKVQGVKVPVTKGKGEKTKKEK